VSHGSGLCLPERRAPALPLVTQLWTPPPCRGVLRCCHVAPASSPREESYCTAMCFSAPDLAFLSRWAPVRPRCPSLTSLRGELRHCRVFLSSVPRLPTEVGSGAATCPMALGSASPRGEFRCCHIPHGPQWAVDHRNKERPSIFLKRGRMLPRRLQHVQTCRYSSVQQCNAGLADHS
jgi:hypothetical protein